MSCSRSSSPEAASLVVEPFLKSLKVLAFMGEAFISSEKVAVTLAVEATPVAALAVGEVLEPWAVWCHRWVPWCCQRMQ